MPTLLDFPARGRILRVENQTVVFQPTGATYELHLANKGPELPAASPKTVAAYLRATARKVWTMRSGGNFITPIFGTPKVVQGRLVHADDRTAVVHATVPFIIELPADPTAYDLINGPMTVGNMVNITLLSGATFELAATPAAVR